MPHFVDIDTCFVKAYETNEKIFKMKNYSLSSNSNHISLNFQSLKEKLLIFNTLCDAFI